MCEESPYVMGKGRAVPPGGAPVCVPPRKERGMFGMKGEGQILVRYYKNSKPITVLNSVFKQLKAAGIEFYYVIPKEGEVFLGDGPQAGNWLEFEGHRVTTTRLTVRAEKQEDWYTKFAGLLDKACLDKRLQKEIIEY